MEKLIVRWGRLASTRTPVKIDPKIAARIRRGLRERADATTSTQSHNHEQEQDEETERWQRARYGD